MLSDLNFNPASLCKGYLRASRNAWVKQSNKLATGWRPDNTAAAKPV